MAENTSKVREVNTEIIRRFLMKNPDSTKAAIAERTGLSYTTCNTILNGLLAAGEVLQEEEVILSGGRPAGLYRYNAGFANLICFYLAEMRQSPAVVYTVVDLLGQVIEEGMEPMPNPTPQSVGLLLEALHRRYSRLRGVGIGFPGVVLGYRELSRSDYPLFRDVPLADMLEQRLRVPVVVENDVNLTALGFHRTQKLPIDRPVAVAYFPRESPPGAGIIIGGEILRGYSNFAGEVSFLPASHFGNRQEEIPHTPLAAAKQAARVVRIFACTINPETLLLTGPLLSENMLEDISRRAERYIPRQHLPRLLFCRDTREYYLRGIFTMLQQNLSSPVEL